MTIISTMASDSKLHTRGWSFRGCLGTCLMVDQPDGLNKAYDDFISDLFLKHNVEKSRAVYKAYDLRNKLPLSDREDFIDTLREYYISILNIPRLTVVIFYTTFNLRILPTVTYYGQSSTPHVSVKTLDFINDLSNYYSYICPWKVSKVLQLKACNVLIDTFQGNVTNAWNELTHHNNVEIFMAGDQCNRLLASADIVTRFIDESLASERHKLVNAGIEEVVKDYGLENVKIYYVGQSDVPNIVPASKDPIPLHYYSKRPSVFLLSEELFVQEKVWFERSEQYDKVLNFASRIGGGFKRVEKTQDYEYLLKPDNYVVYQADNGLKKAEYLKNVLKYPIKICSLDEI